MNEHSVRGDELMLKNVIKTLPEIFGFSYCDCMFGLSQLRFVTLSVRTSNNALLSIAYDSVSTITSSCMA